MKNNLQRLLICLFFLAQSIVLFSQASSADLRLRLDSAPINNAHLYIPDSGDPFALWGKGDFKFSIDTRIHNGVDYTRYDDLSFYTPTQIKLAYSFLPKFYSTVSWFQSKGEVYMISRYREQMFLGDIGIGTYFFKTNKKERNTRILKYNSKWMMEKGAQVNMLLGYSRGKVQHERSWGDGQSEFNFNRFYGQVGLHFQRGVWGFSGNGKFGVLNYRDVRLNGKAAFDLKAFSDLLMEQNNFFFFETSMRFYLGTKFGQVYLNRVYAKTTAALSDHIISDYVSVGVVLNIQGFFKKE